MTASRLSRNILLCALLVCFYTVSYHNLLGYRSNTDQRENSSGLNLPPLVLKVLAGEFKGLMADLIILETGAELGTEVVRNSQGSFMVVKKKYDWPAIHELFVSSLTLDPAFAQTYFLAEGWLPWKPANMVAETQDILKIAAKNRPWDWRPTHDMGVNEYFFLKNPGEAGRLFLEAAKTPNAPSFLIILGARLAQKGRMTETAIAVIKSMLAAKSPQEPGYADMLDRLHALEGVLAIEHAADTYKKTSGHNPSSLEELIKSGIISTLPPNPYKMDYCMDTEGTIYFDKPNCQITAKGDNPN
jgi:hypothetical protein